MEISPRVVKRTNPTSQQLSRGFGSHGGKVIFELLKERWGPFLIDLFATQYNSQLPEFAALWKDPLAVAWDSLAFQWKDHSYLLPPFILLGQVFEESSAGSGSSGSDHSFVGV
jgi:hypothetical protein